MSRYNARAEARAAAAWSMDRAWARAAEAALSPCELDNDQAYPRDELTPVEEVVTDALLGVDPDCPIQRHPSSFVGGILHECRRRDDRAVRFGIDTCHAGAQIAMREEAGE